MKGVPRNTNPFSIIADLCIDAGELEAWAPHYFKDGHSRNSLCRTLAPVKIKSPPLSQAEAEELIETLLDADPLVSFAVKAPYAHIVPAELRNVVLITKSTKGRCRLQECYPQTPR